jgi:excisionase family DNA binding protein
VAYSGLSRSFIYRLFDEKRLPRLKAGRRALVLKSDLDSYLLSLREAAE